MEPGIQMASVVLKLIGHLDSGFALKLRPGKTLSVGVIKQAARFSALAPSP